MAKKPNKVSDIELEDGELLSKNYSCDELVGKTFIVEDLDLVEGNKGEYAVITISGNDELAEGKKWQTGAQNIMARLKKASRDDMFPLEVTVTKIGRAFDIE
jgi:hypothetical protein